MEDEQPQLKSIQHLQTYPLVYDTYSYVWNYYSWAKEKSNLVNYTCGLAENGFAKVATPLVKKFEPQVKSLDDVADSQLARIDAHFPVVKKPTRELWEDSWNYCDGMVQPKLEAVKRPFVHSYDNVRRSFDNGKKVSVDLANQAIDTADRYVDHYLPSDEEEKHDDIDEPVTWETPLPAPEQELQHMFEEPEDQGETVPSVQEDTLPARSRAVLLKTRRRLYRKGRRNLNEVQQMGQRALTNAMDSVGLLETLQNAQAGVGDLNVEFWRRLETLQESYTQDDIVSTNSVSSSSSSDSLSIDSGSVQRDSTISTIEHRLHDMATHYILLSGQVMTVFSDMLYSRLDDNNKHRWDSANHSISVFYSRLRESPRSISSNYLQRMKEVFHDVYETVASGFQGAVGSRKGSLSSTSEIEEEPKEQQPSRALN
jgi:hypothetical protein